ncbi:MAG TPA: NAD(P)/FAD-dependent oxidoreductase [Flavobacteriales bacterium]
MEHFDLCVIGGGPAGYAAAMRALDLGKRTVLIEREHIGGTGIFNGALASKTLWELSQRVASANETVRTRGREPFRLSWAEIERILAEAIFERKYLHACHLQLLKQNAPDRFTHLRGQGRLAGPNTITIDRGADQHRITAEHIIIATGSRPRQLPNIPTDEQRILSSDGIFAMNDLPKSIVIVGAGVIGCEFATILSNFGTTRVHLIDRAERILPFEDADVSELIAHGLERKGVVIHRGARLEHIEAAPEGVRYTIAYEDGRREEVVVEKALVSVGRVPNLEGIGLQEAGVAFDPQKGLPVLVGTRSSLPHLHVVGDAMGTNMLVNLGEMEGRRAVEQLFGLDARPVSYDNISTIMFLDPEVAGVGLNEQECRKQGIPHRVARIDYSCIARAIAMRRTKGFFKLIVSDDDRMRVLGMRAVGEHASSAIQAVALMMHTGLGIRELADLAHPHPSITEGVQECARMLLGTSLFKSAVFSDRMRCYDWRPVVAVAAA